MRPTSLRLEPAGIAAIIGVMLLLGDPGQTFADRPTRETLTPATWHLTYNKGPEIELLSSPPQVQVQLDGPSSHGGVTPFTVPGNLRGNYTLAAYKPGFVYASGQLEFIFEVDQLAPTAAPISIGASGLKQALTPPGWMEWSEGDRFRGAWLTSTELSAITGLIWSHQLKVNANSRSNNLAAQAAAASGDLRRELEIEAYRYSSRALTWRRAEYEWLGLGGGLWLVTYLARGPMAPRLKTEFDADGKLAFNLQPLRKSSVGLRSALLPGWGQAYGGRMGASRGFLAGSLTLALGALLTDQAYARAAEEVAYANLYLHHVRKIDPERTVIAQDQLANAMRVADSAWSTRNMTLGLTAAFWAYNLLDAVLFTRGPESIRETQPDGLPAPVEQGPEVSALLPWNGRMGVQIHF